MFEYECCRHCNNNPNNNPYASGFCCCTLPYIEMERPRSKKDANIITTNATTYSSNTVQTPETVYVYRIPQ